MSQNGIRFQGRQDSWRYLLQSMHGLIYFDCRFLKLLCCKWNKCFTPKALWQKVAMVLYWIQCKVKQFLGYTYNKCKTMLELKLIAKPRKTRNHFFA